VNAQFGKDIATLKDEWITLRKSMKSMKSMPSLPRYWKGLITSIDDTLARELYNYRARFNQLLQNTCAFTDEPVNKCSVKCASYGSTEVTSDIDVTITGQCIQSNVIRLEVIRYIIEELFEDDPFFGPSFDIRNVFLFFDMNFYLSNFAMKKSQSAPDNMLSSYFLTMSKEQLHFIDSLGSSRNASSKTGSNTQSYYNYTDIAILVDDHLRKYEELMASNTDKTSNSNSNSNSNISHTVLADNIINSISRIATYEDECYVSQGAFFHVVMMMQRKIAFSDIEKHTEVFNYMMVCSMLENLKFAMTHDVPKSKVKYLTRVIDAANRYRGDSMYKATVLQSLSRPLELEKVSKKDIEALYKQLFQWASSAQTAGAALSLKTLKKLMAKNSNEQVKKVVQGRTRLVFIDAKRRQYVRVKGVYIRVSELKL
jgi:hypothetical protein